MRPPSLDTFDSPLDPTLHRFVQRNDVNVYCDRTEKISQIFTPGRFQSIDHEEMHYYSDNLDDEWCENVALSLQKRLGCIVKCKGIDRRHQLEEIFPNFLDSIFHSVGEVEHDEHPLRHVEQGRDDECAK